jgi:hypothetical protein
MFEICVELVSVCVWLVVICLKFHSHSNFLVHCFGAVGASGGGV